MRVMMRRQIVAPRGDEQLSSFVHSFQPLRFFGYSLGEVSAPVASSLR